MTPMLAPLVGDATTITIIGLCKNAGKTTAMCRLIEELAGETLAMTSVGRDGERTDVVTGTEKPQIWVPTGTLFATARGMLPLCDTTLQVEAVTNVMTPLGVVGVFRALSDGYIQLAGPSAVHQLPPLNRQFRDLGANRVIIDGAAGRKSLAGAGEGGCALLCVGASMDGGVSGIVAETAHTCQLFATKAPDHSGLWTALRQCQDRFALFDLEGQPLPLALEDSGQPQWQSLPTRDCVLWIGGGVTAHPLRTLARRGCPITVATPDATHFLQDRTATDLFIRCGGKLMVAQEITIAGVTANPWSAYGKHLDETELLEKLRQALEVPVVNVRREEEGQV